MSPPIFSSLTKTSPGSRAFLSELLDFQGKKKLFGFFVGKVMAATQGRADPELTNDLLALNLNP